MCGCSFKNGETCLRCEQNHEYQQSLLNDCAKTATAEELDLEEEESEGENLASLVSLDDMRELRVAHFQAAIVSETVQVLLHRVCYVKREILRQATQW